MSARLVCLGSPHSPPNTTSFVEPLLFHPNDAQIADSRYHEVRAVWAWRADMCTYSTLCRIWYGIYTAEAGTLGTDYIVGCSSRLCLLYNGSWTTMAKRLTSSGKYDALYEHVVRRRMRQVRAGFRSSARWNPDCRKTSLCSLAFAHSLPSANQSDIRSVSIILIHLRRLSKVHSRPAAA